MKQINAGCLAVIALLVLAGTDEARAAAGLANLASETPVMDCAAVIRLDLGNVTDAPVTIQSATVVTSGPAPYCEVRGTIAPANSIVLRLPTQGWTQRYLQTGCGGECGSANISYGNGADCEPVTNGTIASATTDMGHQGQGTPGGSWAANNPQAQIDFAYRAEHVTSQVAKAIIGLRRHCRRRTGGQHGDPEHHSPRLERYRQPGRRRPLHPAGSEAAHAAPGGTGCL
jgi:hypothetical protein